MFNEYCTLGPERHRRLKLVNCFFFRRGRGYKNKYKNYWYGPAKVFLVEKADDVGRSQSSEFIVWIIYGIALFRCVPE